MMTSAFVSMPPDRGPNQVSSVSYGSSPAGSLPSFSPPSSYMYSGALGVAGASPPFRGGSNSTAGDKANPYLAAKKFWKRLCFDPALDPTEYTIGFIETVQQPERKSGVEAWSMRLHDRLCELPYNIFVERFCGSGSCGGGGVDGGGRSGGGGGGGGGAMHPGNASPGGAWGFASHSTTSEEASSDVPYHRIAYFKHGGAVVWESEYHKRRLNDLPPAIVMPLAAAGGAGASDGGGGGGAAARDRSRRHLSRDGGPPLPAAGAGLLSFGSFTPPPRISVAAAGGLGSGTASAVSGRSPRGASPPDSDDDDDGGGPEGASSDDGGDDDDDDDEDGGELLLLEEEAEEEQRRHGTDADPDGGEPPWLRCSSSFGCRPPHPLLMTTAAAGVGSGGAGPAAAMAASEAPPPLPQLPEECWMTMLQQLGVREVCMVGRTCRWLRQLAADPGVWRAQHRALWGAPPESELSAAVVRRKCRRSQLRAARWLEAHVSSAAMGFASTTCLQMDDTKVVSGDGNAVRLWEPATGRRIATLQGHPGRVTSVAFDDSLLVSGCAGAVVKLWSMDDLRCKRTLRGHEGAVTACCLLANGIPVSGSEDGLMRLWDVASGSAIVSLEARQPVLAMQAHAASGHLISAAGWGVQIWDVSTATLLHTLGASREDEATAAAAAADQRTASVQHPYTCVSYMGDLLAAGRQGEVALLDPRVSGAVGRLICEARGHGGSAGGGAGGVMPSMGMGAIAAAAAGSSSGGGGKAARCVGVQMDEWKLVCGFNDGRHELHLYDIRALPKVGAASGGGGGGGARRDWHVPLMTLKAPGRINTFQFHEQAVLVGLEGSECFMWRFENPTALAPGRSFGGGGAAAAAAGRSLGAVLPPTAVTANGGGAGSGGGGSSGGVAGGLQLPGGVEGSFTDVLAGGGSARKEKKKPAKVAKKQTRYPKRNTK